MIFVNFNIITLYPKTRIEVLGDTDTAKINKFVIDSAFTYRASLRRSTHDTRHAQDVVNLASILNLNI